MRYKSFACAGLAWFSLSLLFCLWLAPRYDDSDAAFDLLFDGPWQGPTTAAPQRMQDFKLTPLAGFRVAGRVLGTRRYHRGHSALDQISPLDVALGWGLMADKAWQYAEQVEFAMGKRGLWTYLYESYDVVPALEKMVLDHTLNVHLIPANRAVRDYLLHRVRRGDRVLLEGELVNAAWRLGDVEFRSSLVRDDMGDHACEVMLVRRVAHLRDEPVVPFHPLLRAGHGLDPALLR